MPTDYIFLEIVSGVPTLGLNLGDGDIFLQLTQNTVMLNDGRWHQLQVFRNDRVYYPNKHWNSSSHYLNYKIQFANMVSLL